MANKTYIVSDMNAVFEQGSEHTVVYMREVSPADVQPVRIAQREYQALARKYSAVLEKELRKFKRRKNKKSLEESLNDFSADFVEEFSSKRQEIERGKFAGLYLVHESDPTLPEAGFTYDKIPDRWEGLEYPADSTKLVGSQTTLGEFLKERWWNLKK